MMFRIFLVCLLGFSSTAMSASTETAYRVNAGDVLEVYVWNDDSLTREVLVQPDGKFSFPMVGEVTAGGATTREIADQVVAGLAGFLRDTPQVVVSLRGIDGNQIYVLGKVARPGAFVINRRTDVMQALALAGGLNAYAAGDEIKVLRRQADGQNLALSFAYDQVKAGSALESNVVLHSGDVVVVP